MPEEPSEHNTTLSSEDEEDELRCPICNVKFEAEAERNMHVLAHPQDGLSDEELLLTRELFYKEVRKQQEEGEPYYGDNVKLSLPKSVHKPRRIYKPHSKRIGLTKIRMEDCLRCDACSCIYIDPEDYYKHMRNFHEKYNTVIPRTRRRSPVTQTRIACPVTSEPRVPPVPAVAVPARQERIKVQPKPLDTAFVAESIIRQSIKSRWSKVVSERLTVAKRPRLSDQLQSRLAEQLHSRLAEQLQSRLSDQLQSRLAEQLQSRLSDQLQSRLSDQLQSRLSDQLQGLEPPTAPLLDPSIRIKQEPVDPDATLFTNIKIKQEPADDDVSAYLLSQVEVKIKTEPPDDYGTCAQVDPI